MGLGTQSCRQTEEDIFDQPSSERLQGVLDKTKKTIMDSEYGWVFENYPNKKKHGGFVFTVKFDDRNVTASCEFADPITYESKSLYKLTNEVGPAIAFDDYNEVLHWLANPSGDEYEAKGGDLEFIIVDVQPDLIKLRGARSGNTMYLRKLTMPAKDYLEGVVKISEGLSYTQFEGTVGSKAITASMNLDNRSLSIARGDEEDGEDYYFVPTPTGIIFETPFKINGEEVTAMDYNPETRKLSTKVGGNELTMIGKLPEDYSFYSDFAGNYTLTYDKTNTLDITLEPNADGTSYTVKGLSSDFNLQAQYIKSKGYLEICTQVIGSSDSGTFYVCASPGGNNLYGQTNVGMYIKKDTEKPGNYIVTHNGVQSDVIGFFSLEYSGGKWYLSSKKFLNGTVKLYNITYLTKK